MSLISRNNLKLFLSVGTSDSSTIAASPSGAVQSGTTVTITTTTPHNLAVGQLVTIASVTATGYNGVFPVLSTPTSTTFTYAAPAGLSASGSGTATGPLDGSLDLLITQCSARFEAACNRSFGLQTVSGEILAGNNLAYLPLAVRPVVSITSMYQDDSAEWGTASGAFPSTTLLTAGTDYALVPDGSGLVQKLNGVWDQPHGYQGGVISPMSAKLWGNIKVTYVAGYSTIPQDVQQAVMVLCGITRALSKFGQSSGDTQFAPPRRPIDGLPPEVGEVVDRYRNWAFG
jgi:hypothetical protein